MFQQFYPTEWRESTYTIPFEKWYKKGYRGIIFDIDNTLVPHGAPATKKAVELFERLHRMGFDTCLTSNNKEPRVAPFARAVKSKYIYKAGKPKRAGYIKAMKLMGTDKKTTFFVGDQLFTDVFGANLAGIPTILVNPIHPKEEIQIVLKRYLEKVVLHCYKRRLKKQGKHL